MSNEISIRFFIETSLKYKLFICIFTFTSFFGSIFYSLNIPNIYRSEAILAPASTGDSSKSSLPSSLGSLASFTGISMGGANIPIASQSVKIMRSYEFFNSLLKNDDQMLINLFAAKSWDQKNNTLILDTSIYDISSKSFIDKPPSTQEAFKQFKKYFSIQEDKKNGFFAVTVEHYSPYVAEKWASDVVIRINSYMREKKQKEFSKSIEFLESQIIATSLNESKLALISLLQSQMQNKMYAERSPEFVFKVLDAPHASEFKARPSRSNIVLVATFIAFFLSLIISISIRFFIENRKDSL